MTSVDLWRTILRLRRPGADRRSDARQRDRRARCRSPREMLRERPSGDLFGWSQNAGMGWDPAGAWRQGIPDAVDARRHSRRRRHADRARLSHRSLGGRPADGSGRAAIQVGRRRSRLPRRAPIRATADRRARPAMFDSLPFRNDAATVFRRLIRSLPTRRGVLGVATCDKGLPAMMMALAASRDLPCVLVPGGVTLLPIEGEDAGARPDHRRAIRARRHHARAGGRCRVPHLRVARRRMPVPRHGRDCAGGGRGARHVARALGARAVGPSHLARHGAALGARP